MRKTLLAAISMAVLVLGLVAPPPPALAADAAYTVVGHPITAPGLRLIGDTCDGSAASPPTVNFLERQGGTLGSSALGWSVNQAASEAGPVVTIQGDPTTINAAEVDVFAPTGTSGHAYAVFPTSATSYYVGWRSFTVPAGQWIHNNLVNVGYYWSYYENGAFVSETQSTWTIQDWAAGEGATVAELGVLLGCGGEQFYVDRMLVANASSSATYDFEAAPTPPPPPTPPTSPVVQHHVAHLEWSTDGKTVQDATSVTIRYGQGVWMLGHGHVHADSGDIWYSGLGTLSAERTTASPSTAFRGAFTPTQYAAIKVVPTETTIYRFTADPHEGHPATVSEPVTVHVQSRVRARLLDRHLIEGQKLAVKGKVAPEVKGVKVTLQRKVGRRWSSITTSRTRGGGTFTLATPARTPGSWKLRIKVATTPTNVGTLTGSATVKVDRYVAPKKHHAPPKPDADPTPEVTAPVETPEPTKITTVAPPPPVRPTSTGRAVAGVGSTQSAAGGAAPGAKKG